MALALGRASAVARVVLAAPLVMVIFMSCRVSYACQGSVYALIISRENLRVTLQSAWTSLLVTGIAAAYLLISAWFVISVPVLHFFWVIVSFFVAFYVFSTMTNYGAAAIFAFTISLGVPLWARHISPEPNLQNTLRVALAALIGVVVTAAIELAFVRRKPGDDVVVP